jgi:flagellar assembly protein FliH
VALNLEEFEGPQPVAETSSFGSFAPAVDFGFPTAGDFGFPGAAPAGPDGTARDYDAGYKAGWEDAERRHETEAQRLSEALLHSVQDLSFTLHEARVHELKMLRPLVESMISTLVPPNGKFWYCC